MTSLLKSTFSSAETRVLLVGGERAILYLFEGRELAQAYIFGADEAGLVAFSRCLSELDPAPVCVLVDIVEEEYRQDTIPHVTGADRRAVLERKFARLFRGTTYHSAMFQGRLGGERRDDSVLLTAITRPEVLAPWIDRLLEQHTPIAGIYSLPIVSEGLLKRIDAGGPNVLLISLQKASGLRQSFFRDGHLKISRLAHMPRLGSVPFAAHLMGEVEKLRRYLNSMAMIATDHPLSIYILSHGQLLSELEQHCRDTEREKFYLLDIEQVSRRLGMKRTGESHYADLVFARQLLVRAPRSSYAKVEETQFYALHRLRIALSVAGIILLLASAGWSGFNFIEGVILKEQALDAAQKAAFYRERFEMARAKLPATPVEPREIKTAVDVVAELRAHKATPGALLAVVSSALDREPGVQLDAIDWRSGDAEAVGASPSPAPEAGVVLNEPTVDLYQVAELDAHLAPFDGDYRQAIALVDRFAAALSTRPEVTEVEVLQYPLDVRSDASVSGSATAGQGQAAANFRLKLVMGVNNGSQES
ncbi:MAG: hypothetical protein KDK06_00545 [Gammaproteobacteria bacterium]|nr:hypothetical protein [Gammaproteobacteria bacterium]